MATKTFGSDPCLEGSEPLHGLLANRMVPCTSFNLGSRRFESPLDFTSNTNEFRHGLVELITKAAKLSIASQVLDRLRNDAREFNLFARCPADIAVEALEVRLAHVLKDTRGMIGMPTLQLEAGHCAWAGIVELVHIHVVLTDTASSRHWVSTRLGA